MNDPLTSLATPVLDIAVDATVAQLTLRRPERLNALDGTLLDSLHAVFAALAQRPDLRGVVLTGAGRGFCAGLDLADYGDAGPADTVQGRFALQERIVGLVDAMRRLPQIVVAAVNGPAAGGGLALALGADLRVASPEARFSVAFIAVGLSGGDIGVSWLLPRVIGAGVAFDMLLTGRSVEASEAATLGLVRQVDDDAPAAAHALLAQILQHSPMGVRMTKQVMWSQLEVGSFRAGVDLENRTQIMTTFTEDHGEAVEAFTQKRPPVFKDR